MVPRVSSPTNSFSVLLTSTPHSTIPSLYVPPPKFSTSTHFSHLIPIQSNLILRILRDPSCAVSKRFFLVGLHAARY
jgi:hypothetical protein